ncbi:hypothetical protein ANTRET_LOCUS6950 [Anthophora retusa]
MEKFQDLSVARLKEELRKLDLSSLGMKTELVQRLMTADPNGLFALDDAMEPQGSRTEENTGTSREPTAAGDSEREIQLLRRENELMWRELELQRREMEML